MRLNRYLASCGVASRRSAEKLIIEKRVRVNGTPVTELATVVEPGRDRIEVDGQEVRLPTGHETWLLHKPVGVVTTARDPEGRPTVIQMVSSPRRLFPVGRLDVGTSGALLLTDDGDLAHLIGHPRHGIDKEYEARVEGVVSEETLGALRSGILLPEESRPTAPAGARIVERHSQSTHLVLILHEGRNRQVRRMLDAVGHPVLQLRRTRIGPVRLGSLAPGTARELTGQELAELRRTVSESPPD